jgi:hypothetical protein
MKWGDLRNCAQALSPAAMRQPAIGVMFFLDKPAGLKQIPRQHPDSDINAR